MDTPKTIKEEVLWKAGKLIITKGYALPREVAKDLEINIQHASAILSSFYSEISFYSEKDKVKPYWVKTRDEDGGRVRFRRVYARGRKNVPNLIGSDNLPELT